MENVLKAKVRIDILAILSGAVEAEFQYLKKRLELTDGNLSFHLKILEEAACIKVTKTFVGKKPKSFIKLTAKGRKILLDYVNELTNLIKKK